MMTTFLLQVTPPVPPNTKLIVNSTGCPFKSLWEVWVSQGRWHILDGF